MAHDRDHLPLVYSCSGCSSAAQLANHLAVRLDRANQTEMSCIASVGGGVKSLVRKVYRADLDPDEAERLYDDLARRAGVLSAARGRTVPHQCL